MSLRNSDLHVHGDSSATVPSPAVERGPAQSVAVLVSQIGSPPALVIVIIFFAAVLHGGTEAYRWATLHTALMVLCPLAYLLTLLRGGKVSDVDVYHRAERWRPFLAAMTGAWIAWGLLEFSSAPRDLTAVAGLLALEVTVVFLVTLRWKISLHCATLAVAGTLVWKLTGSPVPLLIGTPLMIWSRLLLRRHTPAQTVAGTLLGILLVVLFFDLFAGTV